MCLLGVPVSLYLVLRTRVGPLVAGLVASYILWFPGNRFWDPRRSTTTSRSLARSSAPYGLGRRDRAGDITDRGRAHRVAVCRRRRGLDRGGLRRVRRVHARLRRWIAVSLPTGIWFAWWLKYARGMRVGGFLRLDNRASSTHDPRRTRLVRRVGIRESHRRLDAGHCVRRAPRLAPARRSVGRGERLGLGRPRSSPWWAGIAYVRGALHDPRPIGTKSLARFHRARAPATEAARGARPLAFTGGRTGLVVVAVLIALTNHSGIVEGADVLRTSHEDQTRTDRRKSRPRTSYPTRTSTGSNSATSRQAIPSCGRFLRHPGGNPAGIGRPESTDQVQRYRTRARAEPSAGLCDAEQRRPGPRGAAKLIISTDNGGTEVGLRRFGRERVVVGHVDARSAATLHDSATSGATRPWIVTAPGACIAIQPVAVRPGK